MEEKEKEKNLIIEDENDKRSQYPVSLDTDSANKVLKLYEDYYMNTFTFYFEDAEEMEKAFEKVSSEMDRIETKTDYVGEEIDGFAEKALKAVSECNPSKAELNLHDLYSSDSFDELYLFNDYAELLDCEFNVKYGDRTIISKLSDGTVKYIGEGFEIEKKELETEVKFKNMEGRKNFKTFLKEHDIPLEITEIFDMDKLKSVAEEKNIAHR